MGVDVRTGLEYHTIAGPKTRPRKFASVFIESTLNHPDEPKRVIEGGFTYFVDQSPVAEGQLLVFTDRPDVLNENLTLFVAIDKYQDGTLYWVPVEMVLGSGNTSATTGAASTSSLAFEPGVARPLAPGTTPGGINPGERPGY